VEADPDRAELHLDNRRVPIPRLILKLGLSPFRNEGPLRNELYKPKRAVLPLKQHAGAAAGAVVKVGDAVRIGDLVAKPAAGQLGAPIHASIDGRIAAVSPDIVIES
jgi:Na+-translocating ferredoxin:NAD+ oxidoreductase RnfC subunit